MGRVAPRHHEAFALLVCATSARAHQSAVVTPDRMGRADLRFAFGSCSRHDRPQSVWGAVRAVRADAFVWLGDVIYADGKLENGTRAYIGNDAHAAAFAIQNANPDYAALREETRVLATWDDHDFGYNNAGAEGGAEALRAACVPGLPRRARGLAERRHREGVYAHHTFRNLGGAETEARGSFCSTRGSTSGRRTASARRGPVAMAGTNCR